jgi:transposase
MVCCEICGYEAPYWDDEIRMFQGQWLCSLCGH